MVKSQVSVGSQTTSAAIPVSPNTPFNTAVQVGGTFSATYSIEGTTYDIQDPTVTPVWTAVASGSGLSAAALVSVTLPLTALRLNVTAYTSGTVVMRVLQGDPD